MRRLILFRHGKSEATPMVGGDRERRLEERGRTESVAAAQWLVANGIRPDRVFISPAKRTLATWDCVKEMFPGVPAEVNDSLYLGEMEEIMDEVAAVAGDAPTVMVVGHNPGLQDLAIRLATEAKADDEQLDRLSDGFPTSAVCVAGVRDTHGVALEAIFEPPRKGESKPRWVYLQPRPEAAD